MTPAVEYKPAKRYTDRPEPEGGWSAADLSDDERVDDDFIASDAQRIFDPLQPQDERLF